MPKKSDSEKRIRKPFNCTGDSRTHQSFKAECDINGIMAKFEKTGLIEHRQEHGGNYGDFTNLPTSYQDALNQIQAADDMFLTVPAKIRARFNHDPGAFLSFVTDPDNQDELIKMGLAQPAKPAFTGEPLPNNPHHGPSTGSTEPKQPAPVPEPTLPLK